MPQRRQSRRARVWQGAVPTLYRGDARRADGAGCGGQGAGEVVCSIIRTPDESFGGRGENVILPIDKRIAKCYHVIMKQQVNVRVSEATRIKLDSLTAIYGTQSEAIAVAIDRLAEDHARCTVQPGAAVNAGD